MRRLGRGSRTRAPETAASPPPIMQAQPAGHLGMLDQVSGHHVEGWVTSRSQPASRVEYEVVLSGENEILARGVADQFRHGLHAAGIGDGAHGFHSRLPRLLDEQERGRVIVRPVRDGAPLLRATPVIAGFEPVLHIAMDIVDNCNLRCPFCIYDYANTNVTHFMSDESMDAALRLLPYVRDGEFWFSCLHEPTMHPKLTSFIDKVPPQYRIKLFYTTNMAKRMPASYYTWLADSGLHHINISIESLQPELYERMRKGARHRIFREGWDALMLAMEHGSALPRLRYVVMVYKSNLRELPEMVRYLLEERRAWQVELRYTFDVPHLPPEFREREFLDPGEWLELRDALAAFPTDRVLLLMPPAGPPPAGEASPDAAAAVVASPEGIVASPRPVIADYYMLRMSWDGSLRVFGVLAESRNDQAIEVQLADMNIRDIGDPMAFLDSLA